MPFADPPPACTVVVLDGHTVPDVRWLDAIADTLDVAGSLELFCRRPAGCVPAPRVHAHPATSDLSEALRALGAKAVSRDVAWVVAGTRVPGDWLARLRAALHGDPAVGTVAPLCDADPALSPFDPADRPATDDALLDDWLHRHRPAAPVQVPRPLRFAGLMRAAAAQAVQRDGHGDWALAVARAGFAHTACTAIAVGVPAADGAAPATDSLLGLDGLGDRHPLQDLRRTIAPALSAHGRRADAGAPPARPSRLHVAHSWGGGLGAWVHDFCLADDDHDGLVLRSIGAIGAFGQRLGLYHGTDPTTPLRVWELDLPIHATALAHLQYRAVLREIVDDFDVDAIVVSSMIGHSLDVLRTQVPTVLVAHDHTPFCVAIFAHFGGECRQCDATRLRRCIDENPGHRFFNGVRPDDWLALRDAFVDTVLTRGIPIVAPSPSTASRWRSLMPALAAARVTVIGHGVDLPPPEPFAPPADGRLRLVKIGRLSPEKGGDLLEAALPELRRFADLTLIGCGDEARRLGRQPGVTAIASFERAQLPGLIAQARPHLGLQLSTVPETFSYTLSELWHCGVPVLGCRSGSLADRIREGDNGFLCEPTTASLLARLRELDGRRAELVAMRPRLLATPQRSCAQMVADYRALLPGGAVRRRPRPAAVAAPDSGRVRVGAISVDPQVTYAQAARAFVAYTLRKAIASPRIGDTTRRLLVRLTQRRTAPPPDGGR